MKNDERIAQIEERLAAITPGPWTKSTVGIPHSVWADDTTTRIKPYFVCGSIRDFDDANFIAHAPEDMRFMLSEAKGRKVTEAECERLRRRCRAMEVALCAEDGDFVAKSPCLSCKHKELTRNDKPCDQCVDLENGEVDSWVFDDARFAEEEES